MPEGRTWWVIPDTPNGPALPVAVGADDDVQMDGRSLSPNGVGAAYAEPTTIHGMLQLGRKEDVYPLHLESGKPVVLTVRARAIGSRMLPYLRITDSAGKELLTSEDQIGQDPRVNFSPPSTGDYRVAVRSVDARGGPQYAYDLVVRPESHPDFRITVTPDRLIAARGQALVMRVSLDRLGGFHAPVEVRVEGLPPGIAASPLTVNAGQTSGIITLSAAPDSTLPLYSTSEIRVVGTAAGPSGGATLAHPALAIGDLPRPGEDATAPRLVQYQLAGINDAVPLYTLSPAMTAIALAPGQSVSVKVTASRRAGDNNANPAIALTLADLPPGVSAETPEIPEKKTEITIKLTASADAKPVTQSALLTGKLGDTVEAAPALVITVKPK
jgi:hypothetical protein